MPSYLHPGVYIEEISSGVRPIDTVGTSTATFIGYAIKGPLGQPIRITKWDNYDKQFGGIRDTKKENKGDPMGHAVFSFFQNGGSRAYIVRITKEWTDPLSRDAKKAVGYTDHPSPADTQNGLKFTAVNEGSWGDGLVVTVEDSGDTDAEDGSSLYNVNIGRKDKEDVFHSQETFSNISMDENKPQYIKGVVNGVSELVMVDIIPLTEVEIPSSFFLGVSVSDDLSAAALDLSAASEADRTLTLSVDGTSFSIVLPDEDYTGDLNTLAEAIQSKVRQGATSKRRTEFTCDVLESKYLELISGTRETTSSVVVANTGVASTLKLGVANNGTELTGQESADAQWSNTTKSALNEATLSDGADGSAPGTDDYKDVFTAFLKYRDINIICLPGQVWAKNGSGNPVISAAIAHAEKMQNRMVIVDPEPGNELTTQKMVNDMKLPISTYTALYYPWVKVSNPYYDVDTNPGVPHSVIIPPCGFAAGIWSKIDSRRGVWKAPAGVETGLLGVAGVEYTVEDGEQEVLNPLGVNALRSLPSYGSVIWGTRTLSTKADPEWRYVPVRRTAIMIEQSVYDGIQWAVFEPNDHRLWSALRTNIGAFMNGLFRAGTFQGEKASDAYFVRCNLGDTMTQADIDRGQVIVIVGFAPLKPAEFVIVRIQQKVGQE